MLDSTLALTATAADIPPLSPETVDEPRQAADFDKQAALAAPLFRSEFQTDVSSLCRRSVELCRAISPVDLPPGRPVYVVAQSTLAGHMHEPAAAGWTWPWLWSLIKPVVPYYGEGPAVVINDLILERDFRRVMAENLAGEALSFRWPAGAFERLKALWVESNWFGTLVHELAHALPWNYPEPPEPLPGVERRLDDLVRPRPPDVAGVSADADQHDPSFTRLAIHFRHRALRHLRDRKCFADIPVEYVGAGPLYGLAPPSVYVACVEDELESLLGCSAAEILKAKPTESFCHLYYFESERKKEPKESKNDRAG